MTKTNAAKKATIYVDVDDEITALIDKVTQAPEKIIALVLPKRATMLQSIVNMKLLKRSADQASKKLVLITSEANILPLAGAVGLHVAKTLQSQPAVPPKPETGESSDAEEVEDVQIDKSAPIGALAGVKDDDVETAEVPEPADADPGDKTAKKAKGKNDKKPKIPNFNKFRTKLLVGALALLLLIGGWVMAAVVLPKADIIVKTDSKSFTKNLQVTASPEADEVNIEEKIAPAKIEELTRKDAVKAPATGEKNVGKKASGTLTLTNCIDDGKDKTVPAGTQFTRDGKTFVTTESVKLAFAVYAGNTCMSDDFGRSEDVGAEAVEGGSSYNISEGSYTSSVAGINAYGSDMTGGTDQIVKVVSQQDIDEAKQSLGEKTSEGTVEDLQAALLSQGYVPFESTYEAAEPTIETSVAAGTEAAEVTVTGTTVYKMTGALRSALEAIVTDASQEDIDTDAQAVSDTGIDKAIIRVGEREENGAMRLSIETIVTAGPQLSEDALRQEIAGKKRGETQSILESKAGVSEVEINYSPFWVNSTPSSEGKVKITIVNISDEAAASEDDAAAQ